MTLAPSSLMDPTRIATRSSKSDLNPFGKNGHRRESASNTENRVGSPYSGENAGPDSRPRHPPILALFRDPATPSRGTKSRVEHAFGTCGAIWRQHRASGNHDDGLIGTSPTPSGKLAA